MNARQTTHADLTRFWIFAYFRVILIEKNGP